MHGGKRPGAGRPKGSPTRRTSPGEASGAEFVDVLSYLRAVALGQEPADGLRIAAAKAALPYESPRRRAPVTSASPKQQRQAADAGEEADARAEWKLRAAAIRAKRSAKNE